MHTSVGAIFQQDSSILMLERKKEPLGWACPAGHVDENETLENALFREVSEETGLKVLEYELAENEYVEWNKCSRGATGHDWYVFYIKKWQGDLRLNPQESQDIKWVKKEDIKKLKLEPVWEHWFKKLNKI